MHISYIVIRDTVCFLFRYTISLSFSHASLSILISHICICATSNFRSTPRVLIIIYILRFIWPRICHAWLPKETMNPYPNPTPTPTPTRSPSPTPTVTASLALQLRMSPSLLPTSCHLVALAKSVAHVAACHFRICGQKSQSEKKNCGKSKKNEEKRFLYIFL